MTSAVSDFDIVVIGGRRRGTGRRQTICGAGISFVVLEARDRSGGPRLDTRCKRLSARSRLRLAAFGRPQPMDKDRRRAGFTIDKTPPFWGSQSLDLGFSRTDQADFAAAAEEFYARLDAVEPSGERFSGVAPA